MQTARKHKECVVVKEDKLTELENASMRAKRHGDRLGDIKQKRTAFGDLTNDALNNIVDAALKGNSKSGRAYTKGQHTTATTHLPSAQVEKSKHKTTVKKPLDQDEKPLQSSQETSSSQNSTSSEDSELLIISPPTPNIESTSAIQSSSNEVVTAEAVDYEDVDAQNAKDLVQVALYAQDIFEYYKQRELQFRIVPYMAKQTDLSAAMRKILVDWLVEVQENFELNHETLYLAVKLIDTYLSKKKISKELLQLIGAVALFVSCKFDERCPPLVQDFLYICDDAYKRKEFLHMEMSLLKTVGFDLGIPLSYRFLRRYAKCHHAPVELLTLCRYILELSLMEYSFVSLRDSKVAAAALYLGIRMKERGDWTPTLVHYSGYTRTDLLTVARSLNKMLALAPHAQQNTIFSKYSHEVFHKVASTPTISNDEL